MADSSGSGLRRWIFWDFARASWQYDVMAGLILAFIFLTPRAIFRDQPRPKNIVLLAGEHGTTAFWIEPDLVGGLQGNKLMELVKQLVNRQPGGKGRDVSRVEPVFDDENEIRGYLAYVKQ